MWTFFKNIKLFINNAKKINKNEYFLLRNYFLIFTEQRYIC